MTPLQVTSMTTTVDDAAAGPLHERHWRDIHVLERERVAHDELDVGASLVI